MNKNLNSLIEGLQSESKHLETLEKIRKKGELEIIPFLLDLMLSSKDEQVLKTTKSILFDLKDNGAIPYIFTALNNQKFSNHKAFLVSILWEAGLDCSDYLADLVDLSTKSDTLTLIEILSVIENIDAVYPQEETSEYKANIEDHLETINDELQKNMLLNLVNVLDRLSN